MKVRVSRVETCDLPAFAGVRYIDSAQSLASKVRGGPGPVKIFFSLIVQARP